MAILGKVGPLLNKRSLKSLNDNFMHYMKLFLVLSLLLAVSEVSICQDYVRIDYLGPIHKPLQSLLVSKEQIVDTSLFLTPIILNKENYLKLRDTILAYMPRDHQEGKQSFGCFSITIKSEARIRKYFLSKQEISIRYFRQILAFTKVANLSDELNYIIQTYLSAIRG